jgi:hypothetical protein
MHVVAIARLATSVEQEAQALAARNRTLAYEERQKLSAGLPAIVMSTPDEARAAALLADLRTRGHGALQCESSAVVAATAMTALRRFRFEDDALVAEAGSGDLRLPWADVAALLRATHRTRTSTTNVVTEKRLAIGKAIATGGLVATATSKRDVVTRTDDSEPVLYLFRRSGQPPWLLSQNKTQFTATPRTHGGTELQPRGGGAPSARPGRRLR